MTNFAHDRMEGSLWTKGKIGAVAGALLIAVLLIWVPAIRWFLIISVVLGLGIAGILRWYHSRVPVKDPEEDKIVLHLNDDD